MEIFRPQVHSSQSTPVHYGKIQRDTVKIVSMTVHYSFSAWSFRKNNGMYFQTFSLTAFFSFLSPDVFLCILHVPGGWNSSEQNPICCNHHGELWSDHVYHLCETLNALCWHADSVESVRRLLITNFGFTLLFMPRKLFMYSSQAVSQHSCPDRLMQKYFVRHCIIVTVWDL